MRLNAAASRSCRRSTPRISAPSAAPVGTTFIAMTASMAFSFSFHLDAGVFHDPDVLCDFVADEGAEFLRRAGGGIQALPVERVLHVGCVDDLDDHAVQ